VVESIPSSLAGAQVELVQSALDRAEGCHCELELGIPILEMDDPTANLEVRWFVDYDLARPPTQRPAAPSQFIEGSFDSTAITRTGPKFTFDLGSLGIVGDGTHVVDMVVAEQSGFADASSSPAYRAMVPGFQSATHRFVVAVTTDDATRCPSQLPSRRVCQATDGGQ
jgi:hypothetical protein